MPHHRDCSGGGERHFRRHGAAGALDAPGAAGAGEHGGRGTINIPPHYSTRRLATGSVRIARTAAGTVASSVIEKSTSKGTAIICGSVGSTS